MNCTIGQLAEDVDGRLSLGQLPPLGGHWEPVGRVVTDCRDVRPGDLFWTLPGGDYAHAGYAEEAYLRGAQGVLAAGRTIVPWAGKYAIHVPETLAALRRLAQQRRDQLASLVTVVHAGAAQLPRLLGRIFQELDSSCHPPRIAGSAAYRHWFQLASLDPQSLLGVVEWDVDDLPKKNADSLLCHPDVLVIYCPHDSLLQPSPFGDSKQLAGLLETLPSHSQILVGGDPQLCRQVCQMRKGSMAIGRDTGCLFEVDLCRTQLDLRSVEAIGPRPAGRDVLVAAYVAGRLAGFSAAQLQSAIERVGEDVMEEEQRRIGAARAA